MFALRRHLRLHRWPAAWLVAFALAVRLLAPAGHMPMAGQAAFEFCAPLNLDICTHKEYRPDAFRAN